MFLVTIGVGLTISIVRLKRVELQKIYGAPLPYVGYVSGPPITRQRRGGAECPPRGGPGGVPERSRRGPGGVLAANRFGKDGAHSTSKVGLARSMYRLNGTGPADFGMLRNVCKTKRGQRCMIINNNCRSHATLADEDSL